MCLTEGVRGTIAPQFISAVVVLQSGEVITSPRAGTAPTGEAVAAGLRRAREARGGYMCAAFVALFCQWPLLTLVPYWCAQAAAETLVWYPQLSEQVGMPMLDSPRCTAVGDLPRGRVPSIETHRRMADGLAGRTLTVCLSQHLHPACCCSSIDVLPLSLPPWPCCLKTG